MELLLVIAILAIVAAAAAPSFFGGAQDAMKEARKAAFVSNFNSVLSTANIYLANMQATSGGAAVTAGTLLYPALKDKFISEQTFSVKNAAGAVCTLTAEIIQADATAKTFRVAMYQSKDSAGTKTDPEIKDPAAAFETIKP